MLDLPAVTITKMRSHIMKILLSALLSLSSAVSASGDPLATVNAFHTALNQGDKDAALAALSETVLIYESGHVERSRSEYAGHHLPADMAFSQAVSRKVLKTDSRESGDLAIITQETETTGRYKDKDVHLIGVETSVLTRQNGVWRIAHVHWSSRKAH